MQKFRLLTLLTGALGMNHFPRDVIHFPAFESETSSIMPFPLKASKRKKFFSGSPFPDIALITSCDVTIVNLVSQYCKTSCKQ